MSKQVKLCVGCQAPLTFMSTPNFGAGYLKDGGRVCRHCFARITKVHRSFGFRSKKDFTQASIQEILGTAPPSGGKAEGVEVPSAPGDWRTADDPVPFMLDALHTGKGKEDALGAAHRSHERWWAVDVSDRDLTMEELTELMDLRSFVLGAVATTCVWNGEFEIADRIQPTFIHQHGLWSGERREAVELYLVHLIFQKQWNRMEAIFEHGEFKAAFLDYHDLYRSVLDPHYEFKSKQGPFLNTVNKVNHYCMQIGVERLF